MSRVLLASFMFICGCAASLNGVSRHDWQEFGYDGFSASIDRLLGPNSVDCGYVNLIGHKPASQVRKQALECMQRAGAGGVSFKFATLRLPIDSYAHEVFVRARDGTHWVIVYDIMIDGEAPQQWNQVCKTVTVDPRTLIINGNGCVERSYGRLEQT